MRQLTAYLVATLVGGSSGAYGYTIKTKASAGCHELITSQALRQVRTELATAAALPATRSEQALINDLQFTPDPDMKDLGAATLLIGVRDNDLKGNSSSDLTELAEVHGAPDDQASHCLRGPDQTEPDGSSAAVRDCRAFIRERALEAIDGLDADGAVDLSNRTLVAVHLEVRGGVEAPLPTYYARIGPAIHALQDSFSHTYRTPDGMEVTVAINWFEYVNKSLIESSNGPSHSAMLDVCDDPDGLRTTRRQLAFEASAALLRATLDPGKTREQKLTAVDATLDTYLTFEPGCTIENRWCDAAETQYAPGSGCGCSGGSGLLALSGFGALALAWRSRRRRWAALVCAVSVGSAQAQSEPAPGAPVAESLPADHDQISLGAHLGTSASFDQPALAGTVGLRLRLTKRWSLGLDAEWNPWIALNGTPLRAGAINVYISGMLRFPLAHQSFNLRSTLSLGGSYLLSELYGAPEGSFGVYFGLSPLGIEWKASRYFYLIVNPASLAVPVPHLTGVPFFYPQYRFNIGLEFYRG